MEKVKDIGTAETETRIYLKVIPGKCHELMSCHDTKERNIS